VEDQHNLPQAVAAARKYLGEQGYTLYEAQDRMTKPTPAGYRDLMTLWKSPNGFITELQFNTKKMVLAKETEGHRLFEEVRTIAESPGRTGNQLTSRDLAKT
jgi:hypothetical protein